MLRHRPAVWGAAVFALVAAIAAAWWVATGRDRRMVPRGLAAQPHADSDAGLDPAVQARIAAFCGDCHALPRPESFPRDRWHREVRLGYEYYARSGRNDLDPPSVWQTLAYYRARAPERLVFEQPPEAKEAFRARFRIEPVDWDRKPGVDAATSYLRWHRLYRDASPVLIVCDMRDGSISTLDLGASPVRPKRLARLEHPCHAEPCDLEGTGQVGLVVADLGSFAAVDHDRGRVVWLRPVPGTGDFTPIVLASGFGRVADVRPADVDGDGQLELIVAEFGHYQTGGIWLLKNAGNVGTSTSPRGAQGPRFTRQRLDARTGTIHVPVCDLDRDGRPDFLALVSNESECLDAFVNLGGGKFRRQLLWQAPDLTYGSSGIELVDLDGDGDPDVLYTNGDAFDNLYAHPQHGVQWLENQGVLRFVWHRLTDLPGAYRALAADLDDDGDLDILAAAWLPREVLPADLRAVPLPSIVCLEQVRPGRFVRHTLETGSPRHPTMEVGDFDGDGDWDFAVGFNVGLDGSAGPEMPRLAIWWNQTRSPTVGEAPKEKPPDGSGE